MWRLELLEAQETLEVGKSFGIESFREYIGNVIVGIDVGKGNILRLDTLSKEVVFDIDMLDMIME